MKRLAPTASEYFTLWLKMQLGTAVILLKQRLLNTTYLTPQR
jgi:hypothetical protein